MKNNLNSYKNLIVWQRSMELVVEIYSLTQKFPKEELYGISSQMKRCAISIPSNIAEGRRRDGKKEFRRFLIIAYGSGAELETQIEISKRLNLVNLEKFENIELLLKEIPPSEKRNFYLN